MISTSVECLLLSFCDNSNCYNCNSNRDGYTWDSVLTIRSISCFLCLRFSERSTRRILFLCRSPGRGKRAVVFRAGRSSRYFRCRWRRLSNKGISINETVFGQPIEWNSPKIVGRQFDMGIFDGFGKMPHFVPHVVIEVAFPHRKIEFSFSLNRI